MTTKTKAQELREQRAGLFAQSRQILEQAETENRDLTAEEDSQYKAILADADKLQKRYERIEEQLRAEGELAQLQRRALPTMVDTVDQVNEAASVLYRGQSVDGEVINPVLYKYLELEKRTQQQAEAEKRANATFRYFLPKFLTQDFAGMGAQELRALQQDLNTQGGFLVPPMQFINDILQNVDDMSYIRQFATVFQVSNAVSLGVPTLENDPADANWTSELGTGSEDTTMSFGMRELSPHPLAKRMKISRKLARSMPALEGYVRQRLAYKFAITFEKNGMTGDGAGKPLGLFTASPDGISTSRDVSTDNTTSAITLDGIINAKYALKGQYWGNAAWMFHRETLREITKLKDGDKQYLWQPSVQAGQPDMLFGLPVYMSEYVPSIENASASDYVGIVGDFSYYWIADALTLQFQVLQELYAESNQIGLIARLESDGQPVLEEAFVRVQLAAT